VFVGFLDLDAALLVLVLVIAVCFLEMVVGPQRENGVILYPRSS
jgi:hypothetical protein